MGIFTLLVPAAPGLSQLRALGWPVIEAVQLASKAVDQHMPAGQIALLFKLSEQMPNQSGGGIARFRGFYDL
jgi:hypothetical protein